MDSRDGQVRIQPPTPDPESPLARIIHERAPLTVAAFMELALYHPEFGYYARAAQRTGRAGDFFTSVDVGPIFGELLWVQLAEMCRILNSTFRIQQFDIVEAGAGNGRLSADILRAARRADPDLYDGIRLHLVEASPSARAAQRAVLGDVADRLASSSEHVPESFEGILIANELFDAMPVHQVVMREDGLREVYVSHKSASRESPSREPAKPSTCRLETCRLVTTEGALSTAALSDYLDHAGVQLEPGWRVEINLRAVDWVRDAARRLRRGFMILVDYGHEARELYSATHSAGTLTSFTAHRSAGPEAASVEWLRAPGDQDITSHVDFTSLRAAAEAAGMDTIALLDQTYFMMGLLPAIAGSITNHRSSINNFKTLIMPGGLGSSHKVWLLGKGVGTPALQGCSFRVRVT